MHHPARLAFLWHHHQPDYRDPATGRPVMPWARLHALRGYRDLALLLLEEGVPMTVNLVPSLVDQLDWYAAGGDDPHLALTAIPAADLDEAARRQILDTFVAGHPRLIEARPGYARLRALRAADQLTAIGDLRDLQVWSTLAWVGFTGLRDRPELAALVEKDRGFTEDDKAVMLAACASLVAEVMSLYRALAEQGPSELTASAYYHPILPLLIDAGHAARCLPVPPDPVDFSWPGDVLLQLRRGRERISGAVGAPVAGLWPSEGSVSPELLPLVAEAGFRWLVSDQGVLAASERRGEGLGPWDLGHGLVGLFRARDLSDAIGFRYATRPPQEAADELLSAAAARGGVVPIALDGENPWESYADAGEGFLRALCRGLRERPDVRAVTCSEAAAEPAVGVVTRLHTGSWINADFAIWIGDREDRDAWRLLAAARAAVAAAGDPPEALEHLLAAEGSDWFWWLGPEFDSPFSPLFDQLFRAHIAAAWRALGQPVPAALAAPVRRARGGALPLVPPRGAVLPGAWDPARWRPWAGAGYLDCTAPLGAMSPGARYLDGLAFGVEHAPDGCWIWLRLDRSTGAPAAVPGGEWEVVDGAGRRLARWDYALERPVHRLPLHAPRVELVLRLLSGGLEIARYPGGGCLTLDDRPPPRWV